MDFNSKNILDGNNLASIWHFQLEINPIKTIGFYILIIKSLKFINEREYSMSKSIIHGSFNK